MKNKTYSVLYKRTKNGNTAWYQIEVKFLKTVAHIVTTKASKIGGKSQQDIKKVAQGKNIGKSNETTFQEQALLEAESIFKKQRDKGYKIEKPTGDFNTDAKGNMKPMLAVSFSEKKHTNFPYLGQPKLDGCRCVCVISKDIIYLSRGGKEFTSIVHLNVAMQKVHSKYGDIILDGEIYNHDYSFQRITSALRKKEPTRKARQLKFRAYDIVDVKLAQEERADMLAEIVRYTDSHLLTLVPTTRINDIEHIKKFHADTIADGYEGIMLRDRRGEYEPGYRSSALIKYKHFNDSEFKITDVIEAIGRDSGTAVFVCVNDDGEEFHCRPQGSRELRTQYLNDRKKLIGKPLTVKYQGVSDENIPRFPVGIDIRDYE